LGRLALSNTSKETLTTQVYLQLRQDILAGMLPPGGKLRIEELSRSYGSGSSPVREALHLLSSEGLVERLEQRGFRVRPVSEAEFWDLLQMRCWMEERALRESIERGGDDWEEAIVLSLYRLERVNRTTSDGAGYFDAEWERRHKRFHMSLIAAASSPTLIRYCDQLYDLNIRYRQIALQTSGSERAPRFEHEAIMEAALARDADTAGQRLVSHYRLTAGYLRKALFPAAAPSAADVRQAELQDVDHAPA
jgi:GntR family carbon starvation induced transcriptional regulator